VRVPLRFLFAVLVAVATPALAQRDAGVHVSIQSDSGAVIPLVSVSHVLDDPQIQELMKNGFPVELHFRLELWRTGGLFNELERSTTWDMLVQYDPDPYQPAYRVLRRNGKLREDFGSLPSLDSAQAVLARPYRVSLAPKRPRAKYYYNVVLDLESLNASDLNELQRWLHGDVQPAVQGRTNPLSALGNGIGRLLSRVLGGAKRSYEATSPTFVAAARRGRE
jgi:hypothetical protein